MVCSPNELYFITVDNYWNVLYLIQFDDIPSQFSIPHPDTNNKMNHKISMNEILKLLKHQMITSNKYLSHVQM